MHDYADRSPTYWTEYSNLQKVKHDLIREYLNGWFPKLGLWAGRIVYLDTHAGRGRHMSGEDGSPLVALTTFLSHSSRDRILTNAEVCFFLVERDAENYDQLQEEIASLGELPRNLTVHPTQGESFALLQELVGDLRSDGAELAPAFVFVDPYGFKVPGSVLADLMSFRRVELFINVIWRELDMAISHGRKDQDGGHARNLDDIFGSRRWLTEINSTDADERAEQAVNLMRGMVGATWATHIRMLGPNNATRYLLLHLTNHDAGRELMKDCMWKVCPEGGFYARRSDDPRQALLITPEPNLQPLEEWVLEQLRSRPMRWSELSERVVAEVWRRPQLNATVRQLRRSGVILDRDYTGRFSPKANPLLCIGP